MLSYQDFFHQNGYVIFPGILSSQAVEALRATYQFLLKRYQTLTLTPLQFIQAVGLNDSILHEKVVSHITEILGSAFYFYPDFTIRQSLYIPWHTDVSFIEPRYLENNKEPNFVQCSIYLQDNNIRTGGGLEVIPGSHLIDDIDRRNPQTSANFNLENNHQLVESKAGDLVLWDSRIVHRSILNQTPDSPKLAVQWTVSKNRDLANDYLQYLKTRIIQKQHVSDFLGSREEAYLQGTKDVIFPTSFPPATLEKLAKTQVNFIGISD